MSGTVGILDRKSSQKLMNSDINEEGRRRIEKFMLQKRPPKFLENFLSAADRNFIGWLWEDADCGPDKKLVDEFIPTADHVQLVSVELHRLASRLPRCTGADRLAAIKAFSPLNGLLEHHAAGDFHQYAVLLFERLFELPKSKAVAALRYFGHHAEADSLSGAECYEC
ncbi:unnamed protein product, partial [Heligmosomoides polygyrus]|uniref:Uncharacterized protein n=1 Tax=Heligmosomoides polygyrus TaxID=6339 RepID=A0A183F9C3_HELPZ